MLTLLGNQHSRFCDGVSRRNFLKIGALGLGGLSLPELLKAEAVAGRKNSHKAVIMIFLPGGPPHQDMFDIKTDAPSEIRGEFTEISTKVPGIRICELFPRMAGMMDKLTIIRSLVGAVDSHWSLQCLSGRSPQEQVPGGWPSMGAVLSKLQGAVRPDMPSFVGLAPKMGHLPWADPGKPGFLGPAHGPFNPNGPGKDDMILNGMSLERLEDRRGLLRSFDQFRRDCDQSRMMEGMDSFTQSAFGILTSSRLADALDLEKEDPKLRDRYGRGSANLQADGGPKLLDHFLMARRLVEAWVRCVTLAFSRWDWHGDNFKRGREDMPMLDQGVTALVEDLHQRGLDKDVSVVVWGEFGRTPKINSTAGRDHWPRVSCGLLACGGMKTGQVIGSTDRLGGEAHDRPVHFQEVFATLYHNLGIDTSTATIPDLSGRPRYLLDSQYKPMRELI
jgi:hypothetical protein